MNPGMDTYIRENLGKYTSEAIREQLIAAGHDPTQVDAALARVAAEAASGASGRGGIMAYVVVWFIIGMAASLLSLGSFPLFIPVFALVGGAVGFLMSRIPVSGWGWLLAAPLVPVVFFFVWWGTCLATYNMTRPGLTL